MAHFAQLDENNRVINVIVVNNEDTSDSMGVEVEDIGIEFCKRLVGENTKWKQTSYNGNFRVRYAGIGYTYDEKRDAFIRPKPFDSWSLNESDLEWYSPHGNPPELSESERRGGKFYFWDEYNHQIDNVIGWVLVTPSEETV